MTVSNEPVLPGTDQHISRLARWSLLMLPAFVVVFFVTSFVGEYVVLHLLGLPEGSLFLMAGGIAGWTAEVLFALLLASAPVAGVWLAVRSLRRDGNRTAWAGLVLNGLLVLLVVYMFIDAIRMSYFAPLDSCAEHRWDRISSPVRCEDLRPRLSEPLGLARGGTRAHDRTVIEGA